MALREGNRALVWKPNAASGKLVLYQVDAYSYPMFYLIGKLWVYNSFNLDG
jgi:hypothetical protein